jgi:hypothetical protein
MLLVLHWCPDWFPAPVLLKTRPCANKGQPEVMACARFFKRTKTVARICSRRRRMALRMDVADGIPYAHVASGDLAHLPRWSHERQSGLHDDISAGRQRRKSCYCRNCSPSYCSIRSCCPSQTRGPFRNCCPCPTTNRSLRKTTDRFDCRRDWSHQVPSGRQAQQVRLVLPRHWVPRRGPARRRHPWFAPWPLRLSRLSRLPAREMLPGRVWFSSMA